MSEARVIHKLCVYEVENDDGTKRYFHGGVYEAQECGKIVGGGICPSPLRIELAPLYAAAPELFAALDRAHADICAVGPIVLLDGKRSLLDTKRDIESALLLARGGDDEIASVGGMASDFGMPIT